VDPRDGQAPASPTAAAAITWKGGSYGYCVSAFGKVDDGAKSCGRSGGRRGRNGPRLDSCGRGAKPPALGGFSRPRPGMLRSGACFRQLRRLGLPRTCPRSDAASPWGGNAGQGNGANSDGRRAQALGLKGLALPPGAAFERAGAIFPLRGSVPQRGFHGRTKCGPLRFAFLRRPLRLDAVEAARRRGLAPPPGGHARDDGGEFNAPPIGAAALGWGGNPQRSPPRSRPMEALRQGRGRDAAPPCGAVSA
jgi:hypothetical protein